jgi:peptidoglycan/xylan/chitin deacetylase (PgdA/CDA1 family)
LTQRFRRAAAVVGVLFASAAVSGPAVAAAGVTAALPPSKQVSAAERHDTTLCHRHSATVALTFDDSGRPAQVRSIVGTLNRNHVRGTFFVVGSWAEENPTLISLIKRSGHYVDNHTYSHPDLTTLGDAAVRFEIGHNVPSNGHPRLLRPPYGAGAFDQRIHAAAAERGQQVCYWTVDTRDFTGASAATIIKRVRYGDAGTPPVKAGGVVLMHMHGKHTPAALQGVIDAVRDKGLTLEPLP